MLPIIRGRVLKEAAKQGMGIVARETFMKESLFEMAKETGIKNKTLLPCMQE
ncbi:MAG: hypothetical protein M0R06_13435 [Sphaerochaeta sp.]|jgi:hypothetical protein|uniref:hypothetical protein n=1 Tax=Sphaerochaeta sp. TaxID=1972642 RepID=UPI0026128E6F|nr:hypothetical protein [Sphaerochaeta sp.]MCK9600041.1 hypothetical protein [Sphaerochaeta sp.]MDX9825833.1 hypothetical protein [Sphaerochaeta sp.]